MKFKRIDEDLVTEIVYTTLDGDIGVSVKHIGEKAFRNISKKCKIQYQGRRNNLVEKMDEVKWGREIIKASLVGIKGKNKQLKYLFEPDVKVTFETSETNESPIKFSDDLKAALVEMSNADFGAFLLGMSRDVEQFVKEEDQEDKKEENGNLSPGSGTNALPKGIQKKS